MVVLSLVFGGTRDLVFMNVLVYYRYGNTANHFRIAAFGPLVDIPVWTPRHHSCTSILRAGNWELVTYTSDLPSQRRQTRVLLDNLLPALETAGGQGESLPVKTSTTALLSKASAQSQSPILSHNFPGIIKRSIGISFWLAFLGCLVIILVRSTFFLQQIFTLKEMTS